jgi:hypothetical protein
MKKTIILIFITFCLYSCNYFSAGSYPYAEVYTINKKESSFLNDIDQFKKEHPEFIVPSKYNIRDGKNSHWNFISFYLNNKIYCTWTREAVDSTKTDFAFIGIYENIDKNKDYIEINKNDDEENTKEKKFFETKILNPILKK